MSDPEIVDTSEVEAWRGTSFEGIVGNIVKNQRYLEVAQAERQRLQDERDKAIARAAEPFKEPLQQAEQQIRTAEQVLSGHTLSESLKSLDMDPMVKTALAVDLRSRGTSIEKFANSLVASVTESDPHIGREANGVVQRLRDFETFYNELRQSDGELPVAAIHIGWFEERDIAEEERGRPSGTGNYLKQCSVHIGSANQDDLEAKMEDVSSGGELLEAWRPHAIVLDLSGTEYIETQEYWGSLETENKGMQQGSTLTVVGGKEDCDLSQDLDFSMVENNPLSRGVRRIRRTQPKFFLVWGNKVSEAIDVLRNDTDIPPSTTVELSRITVPSQNET